MKTRLTAIKVTSMALCLINSDRPSNEECFAETLYELERFLDGSRECVAPWMTVSETLDSFADEIAAITGR